MKQFRRLFAIVASVICCTLFMSCEEIFRDEIEGRWRYEYQDGNYTFVKDLYFDRYGYYSMEINEYSGNILYDDYYESGDYYNNGWDELELTYEYRGYIYTDFYEYKITNDTMILEYYSNGSYNVEVYYRY